MKAGRTLGLVAAILIHAAILLLGGLLFFHPKEKSKKIEQVELLEESKKDEKKPEEEKQKVEEELKTETDQMPEVKELVQLEAPNVAEPALEPLSLSALENLLSGDGGASGAFGEAFRLSSGGKIGGQGGPGLAGNMDAIFSMAELDQKPRVIFQSAPVYPYALRQKKMAGNVVVCFVVGKDGKVSNIRVENSSDPAFEKPALDAVKQWKFEPGVRGGQKVHFKMRIPIKFSPA
jgi:protein TonB